MASVGSAHYHPLSCFVLKTLITDMVRSSSVERSRFAQEAWLETCFIRTFTWYRCAGIWSTSKSHGWEKCFPGFSWQFQGYPLFLDIFLHTRIIIFAAYNPEGQKACVQKLDPPFHSFKPSDEKVQPTFLTKCFVDTSKVSHLRLEIEYPIPSYGLSSFCLSLLHAYHYVIWW